jgi:hypothetical protein
VRCGGLTFQFARFFKDEKQTSILGEDRAGTRKTAIDAWVWNRGDSVRAYDPHVFAASNKNGEQVSFLSSDEIGTYVAGHRDLLQDQSREARERDRQQVMARREYAGTHILPGVSGGRKILVPDNDRDLDQGITLFCGDHRLGRLHRQGH